jgi:rhodanese-related sulfurtransferase
MMTMTALKTVSPARAAQMLREGAVLVDIREADEYAREHIPGAQHHALSRLSADNPARLGGEVVIFHCRSGARTAANASHLRAAAACEAYVLEGGLDAWKRAGLPTTVDRRQPIEIMRQVQIAAGSLVLLGVLFGYLVTPGFFLLSAFVGAGLVFAGTTGFCGMARILAHMPWNRRQQLAAEATR